MALLLLAAGTTLRAQEGIFLSTLDNRLFSLDLTDCSYKLVGDMPVNSTDISFHPNGDLYAVSSTGQLFEIDVAAGTSSLVYTFENNASQLYTALTISAQGIFYVCGLGGGLWSYDLVTNVGQFRGNVGFGAEGDLTFYEGELYMAAQDDNIVRVDLQNPANSSIAINGDVSGRIFGIVSFAESCDSISVYALTNNAATIYEVNFINNSLDVYCSIPLQVSGGASTFEFLGSNPIFINEPEADDFSCDGSDGVLDIPASGGVGQLRYSLDGINYQDSPVFSGLPIDNYVVYVADEVGCVRSRPVSPNGGPLTTTLQATSTSCGLDNGRIDVETSGGQSPFTFSLNDTITRDSGSFSALPAGTYALLIEDALGCRDSSVIVLADSDSLELSRLEVVSASCELANGGVDLEVSNGSAPYVYTLNDRTLNDVNELQNLPAGTYAIAVEDFAGCGLSTGIEIAGSPALRVAVNGLQSADCNQSNGLATLQISGGTAPLSLLVNGQNQAFRNDLMDLAPGNYVVSVSDDRACVDTLSFVIPEKRCPLYFPNAFSPNLDGINDYFRPFSASDGSIYVVRMQVFDRWGGLIWEQTEGPLNDPAFRWDGRRSGRPVPAGSYVYQISLRYGDGTTEDFSGEIVLLR